MLMVAWNVAGGVEQRVARTDIYIDTGYWRVL